MFRKGESGNPSGRPQGAKNKTEPELKTQIRQIVEGNQENLSLWIDEVAKENPAKAYEMVVRLMEFVLPKIKAVELTGQDGENLLQMEIYVQSNEAREALRRL